MDDNVKIYLKKGSMRVDWFNLIKDQGQWHTFAHGMNLWVPSKQIFLDQMRFSRMTIFY